MTNHVEARPWQAAAHWSVVKHTVIYGSGYVTVAIASFALVPVYTRHLTPSDYGLLGLMLVLYGLMSQFYDLGFTNSVGRFYFDNTGPDRGESLLRMEVTAIVFLAMLGATLTAVLCAFAPYWSQLLTSSSSDAGLVRIVSMTMLLEGIEIVPLTMIRMQERSRLFVSLSLVRFVISLTLGVLFVVSFGWGVRGALLANTMSAAVIMLWLIPDFWSVRYGRPSWLLMREMLGFALPFLPVLVSSWFIEASDRYLLGLYRSKAEVAFYVLGYKVAQIMQIATSAFSMGWAPVRYRIFERDDAKAVYAEIATAYTVLAGIFTVAICLIAREAVHVIAPASYRPAAEIVPLITLSYALGGLYLIMVTGMGVAKRTTPMAWVVGGAAAANVGLNVVLIPLWGMEAAALTTVLANVIMVAGGWWYSTNVYPIAYDFMRMGATAAIGVVIVVANDLFVPGTGAVAFVMTLVGVMVFVAALALTGVIPRSGLSRALHLVGLRVRRVPQFAPRGGGSK